MRCSKVIQHDDFGVHLNQEANHKPGGMSAYGEEKISTESKNGEKNKTPFICKCAYEYSTFFSSLRNDGGRVWVSEWNEWDDA